MKYAKIASENKDYKYNFKISTIKQSYINSRLRINMNGKKEKWKKKMEEKKWEVKKRLIKIVCIDCYSYL